MSPIVNPGIYSPCEKEMLVSNWKEVTAMVATMLANEDALCLSANTKAPVLSLTHQKVMGSADLTGNALAMRNIERRIPRYSREH